MPNANFDSTKILCFVMISFLGSALTGLGQTNTVAHSTNDFVVFRKPFTLKLPVDKQHYYEQSFGKTPYVLDGDVYLFKGEEFGIGLDVQHGVLPGINYQPQLEKADVTFKFTQETNKDGSVMMLLAINNHSKRKLFLDALMTVPGDKEILKTSILPVEAGLIGFESWPHPIIQLVLRNLRFEEKPDGG